MNNYIKELLELKNSVVLPGVGGLLKVGNSVSINEYLKFNDGKLITYISEQKNLDKDKASAEVDFYCIEIQTKLESEGLFLIEGLGEIQLNDGKLSFELVDTNVSVESELKTEPIEDKKVEQNEKVEQSVEEIIPVPEKKEVVFSDNSQDLTEEDALEAMKKMTSKEELIDFAEGDSRNTVLSYFLERLAEFNEEKTEVKTPEIEVSVNPILEVKEDVGEVVTEPDEIKEEVEDIVEDTTEVVEEDSFPEVQIEETEEIEFKETSEEEELKIEEKVEVVEAKVEKKEEEKKKEKVIPVVVEKAEEKKSVKEPKIEDETLEKIAVGSEKIEKEAKRRKKSKVFFWVGIILIVSGVGILGYLKQDMIKGWFASNEIAQNESDENSDDKNETFSSDDEVESVSVNEENSNETPTETMIEEEAPNEELQEVIAELDEESEETIVEEVEPVKEEVKPIVSNASSGSYHIIVGSFSSESNATKLVEELKKEGYNGAGVLGTFNGLQSVKLGSYATLDEAKNAMQQSGKDGWIKKY